MGLSLLDLPPEIVIDGILPNLSEGRQLGFRCASRITRQLSDEALKPYRRLDNRLKMAIEKTNGIFEGPQTFLPMNEDTAPQYIHTSRGLELLREKQYYRAAQEVGAAIKAGVPVSKVAHIQTTCWWMYARQFLRRGNLLESKAFRDRAVAVALLGKASPPTVQDIPQKEWIMGVAEGLTTVCSEVRLGNFFEARRQYTIAIATVDEVGIPIPKTIRLEDWRMGVKVVLIREPYAKVELTEASILAHEANSPHEVHQAIGEGLLIASVTAVEDQLETPYGRYLHLIERGWI